VNKNRIDSCRYERKFFVSALTGEEIELLVKTHPAVFSEIYKERYVNNIYLDSRGRRNYFDSINGHNKRFKARIRWYGEMLGSIDRPVLEIKVKEGAVGKKLSFPLKPFSMKKGMGEVFDALKKSGLPEAVKLRVDSFEPVFLNRFSRKYFLSADGGFRITMDRRMEFYHLTGEYGFSLHKMTDRLNTVLELKNGCDKEKRVSQITSRFPFRTTKSSKYIRGMQSLYSF